MKLIDKDDVLAIIDNRIRACGNCYILDELTSLHLTFDSLEVKEVDLTGEASIRNELVNYLGSYGSRDFAVAKHFYELGLKASYNIDLTPNIDTILEEEGIDPYSKEAKLYKEAVNKAFYKYLDNTQKGG